MGAVSALFTRRTELGSADEGLLPRKSGHDTTHALDPGTPISKCCSTFFNSLASSQLTLLKNFVQIGTM